MSSENHPTREKATHVSYFLAWGGFHARSRFARSTIPEEKWGTTRSLIPFGWCSLLRSGWFFWLVVSHGKFIPTNQKYYPDLGSERHQYGISALVSQTSLGGETSGGVAKCRLFLRLASSILQPARTDFVKGMKTPYGWNASKFIHVEFLRHPNVAKFLSVCFPEFQTHEWHPSSCPCGFLQLLWTFSTLSFSFPGNGPLLEAVKSGKAIVIATNQTKLLTEQYIEHLKECFSRFPNTPWLFFSIF